MIKILACLALVLLGLAACDSSSRTRTADASPPTKASISQSMAGVGTHPPSW